MHELIRTNDAVLLSFAQSLMKNAGIHCLIADQTMSNMEGSLGLLPHHILADAGLADELREEQE